MKKLFLTIGLLGLFSASVSAGFKIPRYAHEDLDEAQAEAAEKGKPLAYIYTDPTST
jgi:hypothetical protein